MLSCVSEKYNVSGYSNISSVETATQHNTTQYNVSVAHSQHNTYTNNVYTHVVRLCWTAQYLLLVLLVLLLNGSDLARNKLSDSETLWLLNLIVRFRSLPLTVRAATVWQPSSDQPAHKLRATQEKLRKCDSTASERKKKKNERRQCDIYYTRVVAKQKRQCAQWCK